MKKVIDIEEKIPSMREKRKRKANRKFYFVVGLFVIALLLVLYFQSPLSKIENIKVTGAHINEASAYLERSELQSGDGLWGFTKKNVKKQLEKIEGVQNAEVSRVWFRDVTIAVEEWRPIAYMEIDDQYELLLENGDVFKPEKLLIEEDTPILNGFTNRENQNRVTEQLKKMENNVYQLISEIIYTGTKDNPESITVFMDDGYEVKALLPTFADKMVYYSEIVSQLTGEEKGVIDMEVGTFFTPYSQIYGVGASENHIEEEENE